MKTLLRHLFAPLVLTATLNPALSFAEKTIYISDVLYVPMRTGASNEYRIINAAMKSGTKLTAVGSNDAGDWTKVRTEEGLEGWIPAQYLIDEPTAQLKLNQTLTRLARIEKDNAALREENTQLKQNNNELSSTSSSESAERARLQEELDRVRQLSASAIELDRRYQELLQKHELTQTQRDSLLAENENLKNDQRLSFLLYGAGILLCGVILAIVLPALRPKRGYSEWR